MVGYLVVSFVILALLLYVFVLRKNIAHLQTEYKNLLQESRAQTSNEQRNKENIYLHLNQNFLITYMNDTACQFFNINKGDWLNLPALGTIMEDTAANFDYLKQALAKVSRNPETLNEEAVILTSDKKKLPMKIRIRPMLDGTLACVGGLKHCSARCVGSVFSPAQADQAQKSRHAGFYYSEPRGFVQKNG